MVLANVRARLSPTEALSLGDSLASANGVHLVTLSEKGLLRHDRQTGSTWMLWWNETAAQGVTLVVSGGQLTLTTGGRAVYISHNFNLPDAALVVADDGQLMLEAGRDQWAVEPLLAREVPPAVPPRGIKARWASWSSQVRSAKWSTLASAVLLILGFLVGAGLFTSGGFELAGLNGPGLGLLVGAGLVVLGTLLWALNQRRAGGELFITLCGVVLLILLALWIVGGGAPIAPVGTPPEKVSEVITSIAEQRAQGFAAVCLAAVVVVVAILLPRSGSTLGQVFTTKTTSGPTVVILWTFIIVYAVALLASYQLLQKDNAFSCPEPTAVSKYCVSGDALDYLVLLGIPGAAAALTKKKDGDSGAVATPMAAPVAPIAPAAPGASAAPAAPAAGASASGQGVISDIQYLLFNIIAMSFVVVSLLTTHRLPAVPEFLLALTGASALVYTLDKRTAATQ